MSTLRLTVASWDDREDLVIELTVEDETSIEGWGLVTYDPDRGKAIIDLYPRANDSDWHFDLDDVNAILTLANERIMEVAGPIAAETSEIGESDADTADQFAMPVTTG